MATNSSISAKPQVPSKQFTLRQAAVWTVWISSGLALVSQIGTWWGAVLWIIAGVVGIGYALLRGGWIRWIVVAGTFGVVGHVVLFPAISTPRWAARGSDCQNKLKQITIALHNYHDTYGCFPPAYIADEQGQPMHSWRILILPYLEEKALYDRYDFSEPWNGPNNSKLAGEMPRVYRCPSNSRILSPTDASYVTVVGDGTIWQGSNPVSLHNVTDGTSNTILVVESHGAGIHWMEPRDLDARTLPPTINAAKGQGICSCHNHKTNDRGRGEIANVAMADGAVKALPNSTPPKTVNAMLTIDGGETFTFP